MVATASILAQAAEAWERELGQAFDPRAMRPRDLTWLLNSTELGDVIAERTLRRHRQAAGFRIGDGKKVDFFRYLAWLVDRRHNPGGPAPESYEAHRDRMGAEQREKSRSVRDIGEIPAVRHPRARARAAKDLSFFLKAYFPDKFKLAWSSSQLKAIEILQQAMLTGGMFACGMPRSSGKTTITEGATIWAILYGYRRFVTIIGPNETHAEKRLRTIKTHIESNPRLFADFPEVCYPIRRLERTPQRRLLYHGKPILLQWEREDLIFPNIPGSRAAGAVISISGITGGIRGQLIDVAITDPDTGIERIDSLRPDFAIIDDAQPDGAARDPEQVKKLSDIIQGAILGLAAAGKRMAVVMLCTVKCRGDLSSLYLDREKKPAWQGLRTKMLDSLPTNLKLWDEYAEVRNAGLLIGDGGFAGNEFYAARRKQMDAGAKPTWEARFNDDELSAVQHAMNLKLEDEEAFWAEYQNEPLQENTEGELMDAESVTRLINNFDRSLAPVRSRHLTAFIDVHKAVLYYAVVGWDEKFGGNVIDYGTFPDQGIPYFTLRGAQHTMEMAFRAEGNRGGEEAIITWGLNKLLLQLLGRPWKRDDGAVLHIGKTMIDSGWGDHAQTVMDVCRMSPFASVIHPSKGHAVPARKPAMSKWAKRPGEELGLEWRLSASTRRGEVRHVLFDTNFWKTFVHARLSTARGDPGTLLLWGKDPDRHQAIAEHLCNSEGRTLVKVEAIGRQVWEWSAKVGKPDNHWFDCIVGCAVAASMLGVQLLGNAPKRNDPSSRPGLSDLAKKGGRNATRAA